MESKLALTEYLVSGHLHPLWWKRFHWSPPCDEPRPREQTVFQKSCDLSTGLSHMHRGIPIKNSLSVSSKESLHCLLCMHDFFNMHNATGNVQKRLAKQTNDLQQKHYRNKNAIHDKKRRPTSTIIKKMPYCERKGGGSNLMKMSKQITTLNCCRCLVFKFGMHAVNTLTWKEMSLDSEDPYYKL